ncbi:MAG TPA: alpha/beta family hydrolase [Terriglobia bacterium]|nr:alpha/beta family hydrolase [Terriglobia bacterium]
MHNKVVFRAAKAAILEGLPTLRFNFRGVGQSAGEFGGGVGERGDVQAALDFLQRRFPVYSVCLMGFSFGSWVGLNVGANDSRVAALVGLGVPIASMGMENFQQVTKPKLIVQGTLDQYGPKAKIQAFFDGLKEPKRLHWVENTDHFFTNKLAEVEDAVRVFLREMLSNKP